MQVQDIWLVERGSFLEVVHESTVDGCDDASADDDLELKSVVGFPRQPMSMIRTVYNRPVGMSRCNICTWPGLPEVDLLFEDPHHRETN